MGVGWFVMGCEWLVGGGRGQLVSGWCLVVGVGGGLWLVVGEWMVVGGWWWVLGDGLWVVVVVGGWWLVVGG